MPETHIYKILQRPEWKTLSESGAFSGSPVDHQDGFIHLSTAAQVQGTLDKHYTDGADLILAEITASDIAADLKYEISRGGAAFPHLYAALPLTAVCRHWSISPDKDRRFDAASVLAKDTP